MDPPGDETHLDANDNDNDDEASFQQLFTCEEAIANAVMERDPNTIISSSSTTTAAAAADVTSPGAVASHGGEQRRGEAKLTKWQATRNASTSNKVVSTPIPNTHNRGQAKLAKAQRISQRQQQQQQQRHQLLVSPTERVAAAGNRHASSSSSSSIGRGPQVLGFFHNRKRDPKEGSHPHQQQSSQQAMAITMTPALPRIRKGQPGPAPQVLQFFHNRKRDSRENGVNQDNHDDDSNSNGPQQQQQQQQQPEVNQGGMDQRQRTVVSSSSSAAAPTSNTTITTSSPFYHPAAVTAAELTSSTIIEEANPPPTITTLPTTTTTSRIPHEDSDVDDDDDLVEALPVMDEGNLQQAQRFNVEEDADQVRKRQERTRQLVRRLWFVGIFLVVIGIVVGVVVGVNSNNNNDSGNHETSNEHQSNAASATMFPTPAPTLSVQDRLEQHLSNETMHRILNDPASPQAGAYNWLLEDIDALSDYVDQEWRAQQRFALATLYLSTNGSGWKDSSGWLGDGDVHECDWFARPGWFIPGVHFATSFQMANNFSSSCNPKTDRLEHVWLWANNLEGALPPEFFWLTNLRSINLDSQTDDLDHSHDPEMGERMVPLTLTGTLATEFGLLSHLETWNMAWNTFYGTLPTEIGTMTSLRIMNLPNNFLSGSIPSEVGLLSLLIEMDLGSTGLGGILPSEIWQLTNLERLFLGSSSDAGQNDFSSTIPSTIGLLTKLRDFGIKGSARGTIPTELFQLTRLEHFDIGGYDSEIFVGTLPSEVANLSSLKTLNLESSALTGPIPSEIGSMSSLQNLLLGYSPFITGTLPTEIGLASQLRALSTSSMNLFGQIPSQLGLCSRLQSMDSRSSTFTGSIPSEIGSLSEMTALDLAGNRLTGTLPSGFVNLVSLLSLDIADNRLTGNIPSEYGLLSELTSIWVDGNPLSGTISESFVLLATQGSLSSLSVSSTQLTGTLPFALVSLSDFSCWNTSICGCTDICPLSIEAYTEYLLNEKPALSRLEVSGLSFNGTLPTSIGRLSNLQNMEFFGVDLSGTIPSQLGMLIKLKTLELSGDLNGRLPSDLGLLESLETFHLSWHSITGSIPTEIGHLQGLASLDIAENMVSGTVPIELGLLGSLTSLRIDKNALTGTLPSSLGLLGALEELDISGNPLTGTLPKELGLLVAAGNFESLDISETLLTGTIPPGLFDIGSINCESPICGCYEECPVPLDDYFDKMIGTNTITRRIDITNFYITSLPTSAGLLTNLNILSLDNIMGNTIPSELGLLSESLSELSLHGDGLIGTIPSQIFSLSKMGRLDLSDAPLLSGQIPSEIGLLTFLTDLDVASSGLSGNLPSQIALLTDLEWLNLRDTASILGSIPSELGLLGLEGLEYVSLEGSSLSGTLPTGWIGLDPSCGAPLCGCYEGCPVPLDPYLLQAMDHDPDFSLYWFRLWNVYISSIPTEIGLMTTLEELGFENIMGGTIPSELGLLWRLTSLRLSGSGLYGTFPSEVDALTSLEEFELEDVPLLTGPIPSNIVSSPALRHLVLVNTSMTGSVFSERLETLDYWYLDNNLIDDEP